MKFTKILLKNIKISYYKPIFLMQKNKKYNSIDFLHSYGKFNQDCPNATKNDRSLVIKRFLNLTPK